VALRLSGLKYMREGLGCERADHGDHRQRGFPSEREGIFCRLMRRDEGIEVTHAPIMDQGPDTSAAVVPISSSRCGARDEREPPGRVGAMLRTAGQVDAPSQSMGSGKPTRSMTAAA
jgi:hypothetical protein